MVMDAMVDILAQTAIADFDEPSPAKVKEREKETQTETESEERVEALQESNPFGRMDMDMGVSMTAHSTSMSMETPVPGTHNNSMVLSESQNPFGAMNSMDSGVAGDTGP